MGSAKAWPWESDEYTIHTAVAFVVGFSVVMIRSRIRIQPRLHHPFHASRISLLSCRGSYLTRSSSYTSASNPGSFTRAVGCRRAKTATRSPKGRVNQKFCWVFWPPFAPLTSLFMPRR
ncbi:uncharacterized protein K444DRAFT_321378 [Hyaloscypha bicolor E]|uniref:Uncharacterized protein n=1 Tax=Hyaloscypha bicolor E TaxID=1095630 RepID=A0A2J6TKE3_9HELO|nr:uncharacterized protein K444DRAFT_321378 [Hyaloscypha bicolor E]PMD63489.1 hypothetical protein K444DRAFT_321378 [Hyaloscypha bicolor E]